MVVSIKFFSLRRKKRLFNDAGKTGKPHAKE